MQSFIKFTLAVFFAVIFSNVSLAISEGAPLKIGVLNVHQILAESKQAKAISDKLQKEFGAREKNLVSTHKAFQEKTDRFKRDASVLSEAERLTLEKELLTTQNDLQKLQSEFQADTSARQQDEMRQFLEKIRKAVNNIATKGQYDLILNVDSAPFASPKLDLTKQVIQALDN